MSADPDVAIRACTAAIQSAQVFGQDDAPAYSNRGLATVRKNTSVPLPI